MYYLPDNPDYDSDEREKEVDKGEWEAQEKAKTVAFAEFWKQQTQPIRQPTGSIILDSIGYIN